MHRQVVILLELFERVIAGVSRFIHDISPFKARISGRGDSVALCPSFWLSFLARADRTEPAGFALCGSIANVCMDVSYWLDCTLRPTLPQTTMSSSECYQSKKPKNQYLEPLLHPNLLFYQLHHTSKNLCVITETYMRMMWNTCVRLHNWLEKEILKAIIVIRGFQKKKKNCIQYTTLSPRR